MAIYVNLAIKKREIFQFCMEIRFNFKQNDVCVHDNKVAHAVYCHTFFNSDEFQSCRRRR